MGQVTSLTLLRDGERRPCFTLGGNPLPVYQQLRRAGRVSAGIYPSWGGDVVRCPLENSSPIKSPGRTRTFVLSYLPSGWSLRRRAGLYALGERKGTQERRPRGVHSVHIYRSLARPPTFHGHHLIYRPWLRDGNKSPGSQRPTVVELQSPGARLPSGRRRLPGRSGGPAGADPAPGPRALEESAPRAQPCPETGERLRACKSAGSALPQGPSLPFGPGPGPCPCPGAPPAAPLTQRKPSRGGRAGGEAPGPTSRPGAAVPPAPPSGPPRPREEVGSREPRPRQSSAREPRENQAGARGRAQARDDSPRRAGGREPGAGGVEWPGRGPGGEAAQGAVSSRSCGHRGS